MSKYDDWKELVLGKSLDVDGSFGAQCVDVVKSWSDYDLGISWTRTGLHGNAKDLFANADPTYYEKIENNHNDPNQLPLRGDIVIFAASPEQGYLSSFNNPYGHCGVLDNVSTDTLTLVQQDGSTGQGTTQIKNRAWRYTRCIGWLRPKTTPVSSAPITTQPHTQALSPSIVGKRVYLSAKVATWRVYKPGTRTVAGTLKPAANGGLSYIIRGIDTLPQRVLIQSSTFGRVSLPIDSDATIR